MNIIRNDIIRREEVRVVVIVPTQGGPMPLAATGMLLGGKGPFNICSCHVISALSPITHGRGGDRFRHNKRR